MDSTSLEPLPILVFTNIVMVGFLLLIGRKGLREPYALRPWRRVLMLSLMLLFCIFSAKRKQRVVPVIKERTNGQLGFIKQIGSMHKRNNSSDHIILLKYRLLADKVQKKTRVGNDDMKTISAEIDLDLHEMNDVEEDFKAAFEG